MTKFYVTFGQVHAHSVNGKTFDRNCVCEIDRLDWKSARDAAFDAFDDKWCFMHETIEEVGMEHYPRGIIPLEGK